MSVEGLVVTSYGASYDVELAGGGRVTCSLRGRLRLADRAFVNPVAVGDRVRLQVEAPSGGSTEAEQDTGTVGVIEEILPRRSWVSRMASGERGFEQLLAANVDLLLAVFAHRQPRADPRLVDRLLLAAEAGGVEPALVLNKADLARRRDRLLVEEIRDRLSGTPYRIFVVSAETGSGVESLRDAMAGRICLLAGPSGAGKTSLANAIDPRLELRVSHVSARTGRGRHTTTRSALVDLPNGARVVDTPGIGFLDICGVEAAEVLRLFPEFASLEGHCTYRNCGHSDGEEGCAFEAALADGTVRVGRLQTFRVVRQELEERAAGGDFRSQGRPAADETWDERRIEDR